MVDVIKKIQFHKTLNCEGFEVLSADKTKKISVDTSQISDNCNFITTLNGLTTNSTISRGNIGQGSNNHVLINNSSGYVSSEAQLSKSRGGFGGDISSVVDGYLKFNNGSLESTTDVLNSNSTVNRSQIGAGTNNNYILANNNSGALTEQQYITKAQGGFNSNISSVADGFLQFNNGELTSTTDVLDSNSNIAVAKISEINAIGNSKYVYKDSNGDIVGHDAPTFSITDGSITNAKIASDAAISRSKIEPKPAEGYKFLRNDASGAIVSSNDLWVNNNDVQCDATLKCTSSVFLQSAKIYEEGF